MQCPDCDYEGNGLIQHRQRKHALVPAVRSETFFPEDNWTGAHGKWTKAQYLALLEAVGSVKVARAFMPDFIVWKDQKRPPDLVLKRWEEAWAAGDEQVDHDTLRRTKQRLSAFQEWSARATIMMKNEALQHELQKVLDDKMGKGDYVGISYLSTNYLEKAVHDEFGTVKPTATQIGQLVINAGEPPKKLKMPSRKKMQDVIDAQVRELPVVE